MAGRRHDKQHQEAAQRRNPPGRTPPSRRSSVPRPRRAASDAGRSRLGDLTRPVAREHAIARRWSSNMVVAVVGITVALALAAALFVLPVRTWFDQDNRIEQRQSQLDELDSINAELSAEVNRLQTDDGIREAARDELGFVDRGERRSTMLDAPNLPRNLPQGWPYSIVTDIVDVRTNQ